MLLGDHSRFADPHHVVMVMPGESGDTKRKDSEPDKKQTGGKKKPKKRQSKKERCVSLPVHHQYVRLALRCFFLMLYQVLWRCGVNVYIVLHSACPTAITPSSLLLSHPVGYLPIFRNAGIVF